MTPPVEHSVQTPASRLLLDWLEHSGWAKEALAKLGSDRTGDFTLENLANPSVKALLLALLFEKLQKPIVVVGADPLAVGQYKLLLSQWVPETALHLYPPEPFSPYDLGIRPVQTLREHDAFLRALDHGEPGVYLLTGRNLLLKHPAMADRERYALHLSEETEASPEALMEQLLAMGYTKASLILEPGEFSTRGDILDLYPVNDDPVRVLFFGDTVESLRTMDLDTQRSVGARAAVTVMPRSELVLTAENRERLKTLVAERLSAQQHTLSPEDYEGLAATVENQLQALDQAFWPDGIDYYAPLLHPDYETLGERIPAHALLVLDDWPMLENNMTGLTDRLEHQWQEGIEKGRLLDLGFKFHQTNIEALGQLKAHLSQRLQIDALASEEDALKNRRLPVLNVQAAERFQADVAQAVQRFAVLRTRGSQIFVTTDYPQRVLDACKESEVPAVYWSEEGEALPTGASPAERWSGREIIVSRQGPTDGFVFPDLFLAHFTDAELFGRKRLTRHLLDAKRGKRRDDVDVIQSITELRPGDYVVHAQHGIGQFQALAQIKLDGETREYLTIQYSGQDKLYVPIDQVNLLSRYRGTGEVAPKLNKMGGADWGATKKKAKKSIESIAKDLVALYAVREKAEGVAFDMDTPWQVELEEAFPYTETPDQWQAILDMKKDMESSQIMDRLICGDVGFGKTEVALRGIFKCVLSGKQAAVLVPTTVLAQQHFNTLVDRFQPYGVKMGLLSRFRTPKEQREVLERLKAGECDVVVGTHRLLQKDVRFKDLGLLVIDEEHRFGVSHKEKIKQLRTHVDVLTMSATPIPRTLYMSLSGVREMSLINTPPTNRSPVQTFVGPTNPAQIRKAILQEIDRGGQIYFVHNRVQTIYQKAEELQALVPEARFAVGHGQMGENGLENVMLDFAQHQVDVLLCTTIIESGLDIPTANTMIIDRADRLGLAQLYQLRGRVGRSDVQAYCYCYYDPEKILTDDAQNRLRAIREFTALGSGYQLALRDMEIRGVGNILGAEQHGHMVSIGFDLYCQMLQESIATLQSGQDMSQQKENAVIDLNVTAFIPQDWVGDQDVKLTEYKRLAAIETERGLDRILAEWKDRFGEVPDEARQLVRLARLRVLATDIGLPLTRADGDHLRISVPYTLQEWLAIQAKLPHGIGRRFRWVAPVASKQGSLPVLLHPLGVMSGEDQVDLLEKFFEGLVVLGRERFGLHGVG